MAKAKTAKKPRTRKPKAKAGFLPGAEYMAPPSFADLDEAAADYRNARDARMRMLETEMLEAEKLLTLMHEHELKEYQCDTGHTVKIALLEKVKVAKAKAESNGEAE